MMFGRFWFELDRLFEFRVLFEATFCGFLTSLSFSFFYGHKNDTGENKPNFKKVAKENSP